MAEIHNAQVVAPLVGAWIEIQSTPLQTTTKSVAPLVGAWIEILPRTRGSEMLKQSHPLWVRGLKFIEDGMIAADAESHPLWVRGLKYRSLRKLQPHWLQSHPLWVRGLKSTFDMTRGISYGRRTPCGCVD